MFGYRNGRSLVHTSLIWEENDDGSESQYTVKVQYAGQGWWDLYEDISPEPPTKALAESLHERASVEAADRSMSEAELL